MQRRARACRYSGDGPRNSDLGLPLLPIWVRPRRYFREAKRERERERERELSRWSSGNKLSLPIREKSGTVCSACGFLGPFGLLVVERYTVRFHCRASPLGPESVPSARDHNDRSGDTCAMALVTGYPRSASHRCLCASNAKEAWIELRAS
jgi:hypothetical protein